MYVVYILYKHLSACSTCPVCRLVKGVDFCNLHILLVNIVH